MSDAMKLTDFPLVTSLNTTDTVIATDSTGAGKRISKTNLNLNRVVFSNISSPTWVRVAMGNSAGWALIKIFSSWINVPGNSILVDMLLHPNNEDYNKATVLSHMQNLWNSLIQKMRVVRQKGSTYYIDIYYNATTPETVYVYLIDSLNVTLLTPEPNAEIPEGYTAVEFDITKPAWGGVKHYAPISYKSWQKGGQRHDGRQTDYQRPPQRSDVRRDGASWGRNRFGRMPQSGDIPDITRCERIADRSNRSWRDTGGILLGRKPPISKADIRCRHIRAMVQLADLATLEDAPIRGLARKGVAA